MSQSSSYYSLCLFLNISTIAQIPIHKMYIGKKHLEYNAYLTRTVRFLQYACAALVLPTLISAIKFFNLHQFHSIKVWQENKCFKKNNSNTVKTSIFLDKVRKNTKQLMSKKYLIHSVLASCTKKFSITILYGIMENWIKKLPYCYYPIVTKYAVSPMTAPQRNSHHYRKLF